MILFRKLLFLVLFMNCSLLFGIKVNKNSDLKICSEIDEEKIPFLVDNNNRSANEFNGNASSITLGSNIGGMFYSYGQDLFFSFTPSKNMIMDLNYSGPSASLTIYNRHWFNWSDRIFYSSNISTDIDLLFLGENQEYIFRFTGWTTSPTPMFICPIEETGFANAEKYIIKVDYDSTSVFGFRYDINFYDLNLNTCTNTTDYINSNNGTTSYYDWISSVLNFGYSSDDRVLISNPAAYQYSAIAYANAHPIFGTSSSSIIDDAYFRGTGTFVDETTVLSCAHLFFSNYNNSANSTSYGNLCGTVNFYPGSDSFYEERGRSYSIDYSLFGYYIATTTYLPISYLIYDDVQYDWSLTITSAQSSGTTAHSYMGMSNFTYSSSSIVESAGYPKLSVYPNDKYYITMWTSYPLENNVTRNNQEPNILYSSDISTSGGNSGGPLFITSSGVENGQPYYHANVIGISCRATETITVACRVRPVIINMYSEITS